MDGSLNMRRARLASLAVVSGGAMWGLFWIPVRMFEGLGLSGAWPGLVIYLAAMAALAPFLVLAKWPKASVLQLISVGLLTGAAVSFYGTAIILTDVLRAILFFYLTPVWGTVIGCLFLGERLTVARVIAIAMAFGGLICVVGFGSQSAINLGDVMALASGFFWALGSYKIFKLESVSGLHLAAVFVAGSIAVTGVLLIIGGEQLAPRPELPPWRSFWPYVVVSGLFAVPMILLTLWPASVLSPGRVGILLMSEVVVGIGSVAVLAGEPFGPFEMLGSALIFGASIVEVIGNRQ